MFGFSISEGVLVVIIFAFVLLSGRIGKIGTWVAHGGRRSVPRPRDDAKIGVREAAPRPPPEQT